MDINEILSSRDLAKLLDISSNKLTRLTKEGLPCILLRGDKKIFLKDSITKWLKAQEKLQRH